MHTAAVSTLPGNSIPCFKGKVGVENRAKLSTLVDSLVRECSYTPSSISCATFGKSGIKQHIIDSLNERRRRVHSGHDYLMV